MSLSENSDATARPELPKLDEDLTFLVLAGRARRRLLLALAKDGPQTASELEHVGRGTGARHDRGQHLDSTRKNLKMMVAAGIVLEQENTRDRRRTLCALSPAVKVTQTADQTVFDFGFCVAPLGPDGN